MSVFLLVLAGAVSGVVYVLRSELQLTVHLQSLAEVQRVAALLRTTTRLSDLDAMLLYPADGTPIAISYPLPGTTNVAGDAVLDASGRVAWRETVVFHAWPSDEPTELRLTRFSPCDHALTRAQREANLEQVVLDGDARNVASAVNRTTRSLTRLAPEFNLRSNGRTYDFYAAADTRDLDALLGGVLLRPGVNTIRFRSVGKRSASGGCGLRLDQLRISPAGIPIEAEALMPPTSQSGASATVVEDVASNWSERRVLTFPATASNAVLELSFHNDTWHETLFLDSGSVFDQCLTELNEQTGSVGVRLRPSGHDLAWSASFQTGGEEGMGATNALVWGAAVRVLVRGADAVNNGQHILANGDGCRVTFRASDWPGATLHIVDAFISEAADSINPGPDIDSSTTKRLRFGTPADPKNARQIGNGSEAITVPLEFAIDTKKSYVISYRVNTSSTGLNAYPWLWESAQATNSFDSYLIPRSSSPTRSLTQAATWSSRSDVVRLPSIVGVVGIETTYAKRATYVSRIVDTRLAQPEFLDINWDATVPTGTAVELRGRTGANPDLSDAPAWETIGSFSAPGTVSFSSGRQRYVQMQVTLHSDLVNDEAPGLNSFTLRWLGDPTFIDVGGIFGRYTSGGQVEVLVNGVAPAAALRADLGVRGETPLGSILAWALGVEIAPRN